MNLEDISKKADENAKLINENKKLISDNMKKIQSNFEQIQNNSYALEFIKDYKNESKKLFIALIVVLVMWFITIGYLVYVLNDTGVSEETIEIEDVETIDNSHIKIGDDIWEKSN